MVKPKRKKAPKISTIVLLHDIRSSQNVGAIFRTADAIGVGKIFLTGYTPAPMDKFGRENGEIKKTALGAEKSVSWERAKSPISVLKKLKKERFQILALEQDKRAIDYKKIKTKNNFALILGNEVAGIPKKVLSLADKIIEIPMRGKKESLNIAVAFGITIYRMLDN